MNLEQFYDELERFDWYYDMREDHADWRKGNSEYNRLLAISSESPAHKALFKAYAAHMYTGKTWGNERTPKPERPTSNVC